MLTAQSCGCIGVANERVSPLQPLQDFAKVTPANEPRPMLTDFHSLSRQRDVLRKQMEKIVDVHNHWNQGVGWNKVGLFLVADQDKIKLVRLLKSMNGVLHLLWVTVPAGHQTLPR